MLEIAAVSQQPLAAAEKRSVWAPGDGQLTVAGYGKNKKLAAETGCSENLQNLQTPAAEKSWRWSWMHLKA